MKFIEMTGKTLAELLTEEELQAYDLHASGVDDETIVRVNQHGDIEIRRPRKWDVIGGLLGGFEERIQRVTGMEWA